MAFRNKMTCASNSSLSKRLTANRTAGLVDHFGSDPLTVDLDGMNRDAGPYKTGLPALIMGQHVDDRRTGNLGHY
jgi:hypothetical protein